VAIDGAGARAPTDGLGSVLSPCGGCYSTQTTPRWPAPDTRFTGPGWQNGLMPRPIQAVIHTQALAHNLRRARLAAPDARVWAVVKADAYGHGIANA